MESKTVTHHDVKQGDGSQARMPFRIAAPWQKPITSLPDGRPRRFGHACSQVLLSC